LDQDSRRDIAHGVDRRDEAIQKVVGELVAEAARIQAKIATIIHWP
jgi:hypothetical protein